MTKVSKNVDTIVKSIYSKYIALKSGEFNEIEKDILLDEIKDLYLIVKGMSVQQLNTVTTKKVKEEVEEVKEKVFVEEPVIQKKVEAIKEEIEEQKVQTQKSEPIEIPEIKDTEEQTIEFDNDSPVKEKSSKKIEEFLKTGEVKKDIYDFMDINTRIGLVEKFFKGDSLSLSEALVELNKLDDKSKSIKIVNNLAKKYNISDDSDIYATFVNLIDRRLTS